MKLLAFVAIVALVVAAVYAPYTHGPDPRTVVKQAVLDQLRFPADAIFEASAVDQFNDNRCFVRGLVSIKSPKGSRVQASYQAFVRQGQVSGLVIEPSIPAMQPRSRKLNVSPPLRNGDGRPHYHASLLENAPSSLPSQLTDTH